MSLSRLALRLAAVEVLCPSAIAATGPYPTWAGNEVYDSRISTISDVDGWQKFLAQVEGKPIVMVYTEEQETTPMEGARYPAEIENVDLVIETMIAASSTVEVDGQEVGSLGAPITSAQHEAMLDVLEAQIRGLLDPNIAQPFDATVSAARSVYLKVAREMHHVKSAPIRDVDKTSRHAARTLTFKMRIPFSRPFRPSLADGDATIAGLPEPLYSVAASLDPSSAAGVLVRQMAAGIGASPVLPTLSDIRISTNVDRGVTPTADNADVTSDVSL
jgi:hypothetical protein